MSGLSVTDDDFTSNYAQMTIFDSGDGLKQTTLSICEGCDVANWLSGYGIHLIAENDDPTVTFKFRDGRSEECHAPATDSDFKGFLGT